MNDLLELGAFEAASLIQKGEVSSLELTQTCLDALSEHGPKLNAIALLYPEEALQQAAAADAARARGDDLGPLHGVPLAHKDMFYRAGKRCATGSKARADFVPDVTATVVQRLDQAGAVDLGRLNMVEFALGLTGHNAITGHPKNPYNHEYLTGGSSSGPAATVAARLNFATLGSDTGGSIRVPSAACGLYGLKPTYGRVSRAGAMPLAYSLDHVGPLARSAQDLALMMAVIAGHDPDDPTTSLRPVPDYLAVLDGGIKGLRLAVPELPIEQAIDPVISSLFERSLQVFRDLGAEIRPVKLPSLEELNQLRRVLMYVEVAGLHRRLIASRPEDYNPATLARMFPGLHIDAVDYLDAVNLRTPRLRAFVTDVFAQADCLALPTLPSPMPSIAATDLGGDQKLVEMVNALGAFVSPFNYLGLPVAALPAGLDNRGIPSGIQLIGRPFTEDLLLRAGHAYQAAAEFAGTRPPAF